MNNKLLDVCWYFSLCISAKNGEVKQIPQDRNAQLHFMILLLLLLLTLLMATLNIPVCAYQHTNEPFYVGNSIPQGLVEQ